MKALGHTVVGCRPSHSTGENDSLYRRCQTANNASVDAFVSLHFNCFNGSAHGTEVYAISPRGRSIAQSVLSKIVDLGFRNRGVKNKGFYVLRNTKAPAILIEGCFIDSQRDMNLFNAEKMATAIVKGLTAI
ncbi:MAG: N-acetylmuramoyl-L-alanine amidase [Cyanobacteria bacterium P01_A01_bin.83]